ncbi:MAG: RNA polymerase sigma factor [bacterium]|nr:RNA polymerase sigma factor [bacterium]
MDETTYIAVSEQYMPSLYRAAYSIVQNRHDAEDAVQQALLNAWKGREKARDGAERAWMMRIVINECYTILRKRQRSIPADQVPETPAQQADPALYEAISALPENLRTPFLLKYMEGMTEKEVAAALRLPLPSVKNRLFRARKKLQKELQEEVGV